MQHHISLLNEHQRAQGEKPGVTGARADDGDIPGPEGRLRQLEFHQAFFLVGVVHTALP